MSSLRLLYVFLICFGLFFPLQRGTIDGVVRWRLNRSNYRKRRKAQTVWEWFTFKKFKDVIPKHLLFGYYSLLPLAFLGIIITLILYWSLGEESFNIIRIPAMVYWYGNCAAVCVELITWGALGKEFSPGKRYERKKRNKK